MNFPSRNSFARPMSFGPGAGQSMQPDPRMGGAMGGPMPNQPMGFNPRPNPMPDPMRPIGQPVQVQPMPGQGMPQAPVQQPVQNPPMQSPMQNPIQLGGQMPYAGQPPMQPQAANNFAGLSQIRRPMMAQY
jgi:cell division protein ZipA